MNATMVTQVSSMNTTPPSSPYWDGFNGYCEGQQLEDMPTADHQRGWWFANTCEGACPATHEVVVLTDAEADAMTDEYEDWLQDVEWMRGGC